MKYDSPQRSWAFTLIELLGVIAIIAILAAMLLPTLNAIYADFHAALWKVVFRQNEPGNYYDPNWFTYGVGGGSPRATLILAATCIPVGTRIDPRPRPCTKSNHLPCEPEE